MYRRVLGIVLTFIMMLSLCSFSQETPGDDSDYIYTNKCSSSLNIISSSTGECVSYLLGYPNITTKIVVKQYLQVRDGNRWRTSQSWSNTYYSYHANFVNNRTLYSGNTYRVYSEFTVYSGSNYENVYAYSTTHTV